MIARGRAVALGLVAVMAGPAQADWFMTHHLGSGMSTEDCVARSMATLQSYAQQSGSFGDTVSTSAWSAQAYDLAPGGVDVQFLCPWSDGIVVAVLMVMHSSNTYVDIDALSTALVAVWEATPVPAASTLAAEPAPEPASQPEPEPPTPPASETK